MVVESMNIIQKHTFDIVTCRKDFNDLIEKLKRRKHETVFKGLVATVPSSAGQQIIISGIFPLYIQILDNIIYEIETVKENYSNFFETSKLKTELDLLYSDLSIVGIGEDIPITKISNMMKFMYDHEINNYLPNLYKFMALIVTISSVSEPLQGNDCVLNRIREYCKTERNEEPKSSLALLKIETELFCDLEKTQNWYDQVITYFSHLPSTSSIELTYKTMEETEVLDVSPKKLEIVEPELDIKSESDFEY